MRTKVVYVLVSKENDWYLEQLFISLTSLKQFNPFVHSCVVTDQTTKASLCGKRANALNLADEIVVVDVPEKYTGAASSRYLKTSLRKYVKGAFLYVDTDTIIADNLDEIDSLIDQQVSIAAVKDSHCLFAEMIRHDLIVSRAKKAGFGDIENDKIHFNGGVTFAADNNFAHEFYKKWHENWIAEQKKGFYYDQLALAWTNRSLNFPIHDISGIWNCQLFNDGLPFLYRAKIIHYSEWGSGRPYYFQNTEVYMSIKETGKISEEIKERIIHSKEAFVGHHIILGNSENRYLWSSISKAAKGRPRLFRMLEKIAHFIMSLKK